MIEANNLQKHFGRVTAVRDVSLLATDGRITGLLGPNGAGKSTTLRILYTVIAPETGDALIDGMSVVSRPLEARRRMGVLPHNAGIYPHLSARENIAYFGALPQHFADFADLRFGAEILDLALENGGDFGGLDIHLTVP